MMKVSEVEECLIERVSIEEAEKRENTSNNSNEHADPPFRRLQGEWVELLSNMEPGDELWSFSTLRAKKAAVTVLADGYVIRRGDLLVDYISTTTYF